jgi:predicted nucleotidyltransferase
LTDHEILERLPVTADYAFLFGKKKKISSKKIKKNSKKINTSLNKLLSLGLIKNKNNYYFLKKIDLESRKKRSKYIADKKKAISEFVILAQKIPFIKNIYLTGSTAADNAREEDDLDFLIICQPNTIWLSRFLLILLTKMKGKQPHLDNNLANREETKNAWCLNMWLDQSNLSIPKKRRSIYEAYEVLQMKLIYDQDGSAEQLFLANKWLNSYLDFPNKSLLKANKSISYKKNIVLSVLNWFLYYLQIAYRSIFYNDNGFLVSKDQAYFNSSNFRDKILKNISNKLIY